MLNSSKLDSYGKFKIDQQKKFKNNVWTSYQIIDIIKNYIETHNLEFKTALDPCAGSGRLITEFNEYTWRGYEIDKIIIEECQNEDVKKSVVCADFLKTEINEHFDLCLCNPPYNKNGGINNWVKKILSCCSYLFLIVPYNFITKIKAQKNLIDVLHCEDDMDKTYHTSIKVYIFTDQEQEQGFYENPANKLFYINKHIKKHKSDSVIYLRDYLTPCGKNPQTKIKISDIPDGTKFPVYTVANNPVKYTDSYNCEGNKVLVNHSYLSSCMTFKFTRGKCYLNEMFTIYEVKEDKLEEFKAKLFIINNYLLKLFALNNVNVVLNQEDILNIPVFIPQNGSVGILEDEFKKHMQRFKYQNYIKKLNVEWLSGSV